MSRFDPHRSGKRFASPLRSRGGANHFTAFKKRVGLSALLLLTLLVSRRGLASDGAVRMDEIPPLRPPIPEIQPSTWERYGTCMVLGALAAVILLTALCWWLLRPKPVPPDAPEVVARKRLKSLLNDPHGGSLSLVSRALRAYLTDAFKLPPGETTTSEFADVLNASSDVGPELSAQIVSFLRRCDQEKFSVRETAGGWDAAAEALALLDVAETKRRASSARAPQIA